MAVWGATGQAGPFPTRASAAPAAGDPHGRRAVPPLSAEDAAVWERYYTAMSEEIRRPGRTYGAIECQQLFQLHLQLALAGRRQPLLQQPLLAQCHATWTEVGRARLLFIAACALGLRLCWHVAQDEHSMVVDLHGSVRTVISNSSIITIIIIIMDVTPACRCRCVPQIAREQVTTSSWQKDVAAAFQSLGYDTELEHKLHGGLLSIDIAVRPPQDAARKAVAQQQQRGRRSRGASTAPGTGRGDKGATGRMYHVEYDGLFHFTRNAPYGNGQMMIGDTVLRDYMLTALGCNLVTIPWFEWAEACRSEEAKAAYLRAKLQAAEKAAQRRGPGAAKASALAGVLDSFL